MARKAKAKAVKREDNPAKGLLDALKFVSFAQKKTGEVYQTHVCIMNKLLCAYNGVIAMGYPVEESLRLCPHTHTFKAALAKCKGPLTLTQESNNTLTVESGKLSVSVPCVSCETMATAAPDPQVGELNNSIRDGFKAVGWIADAGAPKAFATGVSLTDNRLRACNGVVAMEYWHGINLPEDKLIPKEAVDIVCKTKSDLVGFGFSTGSFTFWFSDKSFIKTALIASPWPNTDGLFNNASDELIEVTPELREAVTAVSEFSVTGAVYFGENEVRSHYDGKQGATYNCGQAPEGRSYNGVHLSQLLAIADKASFPAKGNAVFYGSNIRGLIGQSKV